MSQVGWCKRHSMMPLSQCSDCVEERVADLRERLRQIRHRLEGAEYDIGRTRAEDYDSGRLMDAYQGITEALVLAVDPQTGKASGEAPSDRGEAQHWQAIEKQVSETARKVQEAE